MDMFKVYFFLSVMFYVFDFQKKAEVCCEY